MMGHVSFNNLKSQRRMIRAFKHVKSCVARNGSRRSQQDMKKCTVRDGCWINASNGSEGLLTVDFYNATVSYKCHRYHTETFSKRPVIFYQHVNILDDWTHNPQRSVALKILTILHSKLLKSVRPPSWCYLYSSRKLTHSLLRPRYLA